MKIVVTGSLGNISRPLTEFLVHQGHQVTVISSDRNKTSRIASMGAKAAIGSIADASFLENTFEGSDAVFAMIPLDSTQEDLGVYMRQMAHNYVEAIRASKIKRVVILSGWAADLIEAENIEHIFGELDVSITFLRPAIFYTNFYQSMELIRGKGLMGKLLALRYYGISSLWNGKTGLLMGNYGGEDRVVFVAPEDIAIVAAEELIQLPDQRSIRYVGSEEMTCNEAAKIIGNAIGKPWLKWVLLSDKKMMQGFKMAKMPEKLASILTNMQAAIHSGKALENFHKNGAKMGHVKLSQFAAEFAQVYHRKS